MKPLRSLLRTAAGSPRLRKLAGNAPAAREAAARYLAGESSQDAVAAAGRLAASGLRATLAHLGAPARDTETAHRNAEVYVELLDRLSSAGLATGAEVSVRPAELGVDFDRMLAYKLGRRICEAAELAGTTVTFDMADHTTTEDTLNILGLLRGKWPATGVTVQAYLNRTEEDCQELAGPDARVRLCKGAYPEPGTVAATEPQQIDRNYLRCANLLFDAGAYPMFATHDPRLHAIVAERANHYGRAKDGFEFQLYYGVAPEQQRELAAQGHTVRVYVPFGEYWSDYLLHRLADHPADIAGIGRTLVSKR